MAFTVSLYTFSKRENSTKRPDTSPATFACTLKSNCSIHNPVLELRFDENPTQYNYVGIGQFGRFYFIESWEWDAGRWLAHCREDVLATWKDIIGASTQYVLRSSATYDGDVMDTLYPTKGGAQIVVNEIDNPFAMTYEGGTYVIGIVNGDSATIGASSYYAFTPEQFKQFIDTLMSDVEWLSIDSDEISEGLTKALFNPTQYITSALWFPWEISGTPKSSVQFGWWELSCTCRQIKSLGTFVLRNFTVPKHPLAASRGNYLNNAPYTRYALSCRPFGEVPIDSTLIYNMATITLTVRIDYSTGQATLYVHQTATGADDVMQVAAVDRAQLALPMQLAEMSRDYIGAAATAVGSIAGAAASFGTGNFAGVINSAVSGITSTINSLMPQLRTTGSVGAIADYLQNWRLQAEFYSPVAEDNADRGRPLCQMKQISTIPGYIMCADADVELPASAEENREVKAYMESGFFYE